MIFTFEHNDLTTIVKMFNKRRNEFDEIDVYAIRSSVILMNNLKCDTNEESPVSVHTAHTLATVNERKNVENPKTGTKLPIDCCRFVQHKLKNENYFNQ